MQNKKIVQEKFTKNSKAIICSVTLFFMILLQPLVADDFHIELESLLGMRFGTVGEYVYTKQESDYKKLSDLHWNLMPIWTAGGEITLQYKKLVVSIYGDFGFPVTAGFMEDTDYLYLDDKITNFSHHDMRLNSFLEAGGYIGFKFSPLLRLSIKPYVGFSSQQITMMAFDGYIQYLSENSSYTEWSEDIPKTDITGDCIQYKQEYYLPWAGLEVDFNSYLFSNVPITIKCSAAVAPYVWAFALDKHLKRSIEFFDQMEGGYALNFNCTSFFWVTKNDAVVFGLGYTSIPEIVGSTALRAEQASSFVVSTIDKGATSFQTFKVSLGYKRMLFN